MRYNLRGFHGSPEEPVKDCNVSPQSSQSSPRILRVLLCGLGGLGG
jgi:hypothetical protein